jgi:hypothetical protein
MIVSAPSMILITRAAALRAELERNKVVSVETSMDDAMAAKFHYRKAVT